MQATMARFRYLIPFLLLLLLGDVSCYRRSAAISSSVDDAAVDPIDFDQSALTTSPYQFPWMVHLEIFFGTQQTSKYCGATLIAAQWVLTSASCVLENRQTAQIVIASLGKHNIGLNMEPREVRQFVSSIVIHPEFIRDSSYDFALLKLNMPVRITPQVRPVSLPDRICQAGRYTEVTTVIDRCRVGTTTSWSPVMSDLKSNVLKKVTLPLQPYLVCSATMEKGGPFSTAKICAGGDEGGMDTCMIGGPGDPLLCHFNYHWYQIGVLSTRNTTTCLSSHAIPRIYGRVCTVTSWIESVVMTSAGFQVSSVRDKLADPLPPMPVEPETCGPVPFVLDGYILDGSSEVGAIRNISCKRGFYIARGASWISCASNKTWSQPGHCTLIAPTTTARPPETTPASTMSYYFAGDEIIFNVNQAKCSVPYIPDGYFMVDGIAVGPFNLVKVNIESTLHCMKGYVAMGSPTNKCGLNGNWLQPHGKCVKRPVTPAPFNGPVRISVPEPNNGPQGPYANDYFLLWKKRNSKVVFTAPSDIYAIIEIPSIRPTAQPNVVIVCFHGEVIELTGDGWSAVKWQSSVSPPQYQLDGIGVVDNSDNNFTVSHAVYDRRTDEIYFALSSHPTSIYRAARSELEDDRDHKGVELRYLVVDSVLTNGLRYSSLTIDADRRLLYACDGYPDSQGGDISVWYLPNTKSTLARLVAIIKTDLGPSFVAVHFASNQQMNYLYSSDSLQGSDDNDDADITAIMFLAISNSLDNTVELLATDFGSFAEDIQLHSDRQLIAVYSTAPNSIKMGFKKLATVARWNRAAPSQSGSVNNPRELHFDSAGRLLVADDLNFRIQIFEMKGERNRLMRPVWLSSETGWELWSLCTMISNSTTGAITALVSKYNEILAFE